MVSKLWWHGALLGLVFSFQGFAEDSSETGSATAVSSTPASLSAEDILRREVERRSARKVNWDSELQMAERLYQDAEWEAALRKFQAVAAQSESNTAAQGYHAQAQLGVARCLTAQAMDKEKEGQKEAAAGLLRQAAKLDPKNPALAKKEAKITEENQREKNPFPENPAYTKDLVEKTSKIKELLSKADQLKETGQLNKAREVLEDVLSIDPYNRVAIGKVEKLENELTLVATEKYRASRTKALAAVGSSWWTNYPLKPKTTTTTARSTGAALQSSAATTLSKLGKIKIPQLVFNERPIRQALEELQILSVKHDTNNQTNPGVDIVFQSPSKDDTTNPTKPGADAASQSAPTEPSGKKPTYDVEAALVTLTANGQTLQAILDTICTTVRGGVKYRVEPRENNVVVVLPVSGSYEGLETRTFDLPPSMVNSGADSKEVDASKQGEAVLKDMGITMRSDEKAILFRETGKLVVRSSPSNLDKISLQLQSFDDTPPEMYSIETKFLQFTENDVKNFTANISVQMYQNNLIPGPGTYNPVPAGQNFSPNLPAQNIPGGGGGTSGLRGTSGLNANGVSVVALQSLLDPGYPAFASNQVGLNYQILGRGVSFVLQLLQNAIGRDLMAAPRVTVSDGAESKITIARRMYYPTSYTQPTVPSNDQGIGAGFILPSNPTGFEYRDVGVSLMVTAKSTPNLGTVDLDFGNLLVDDFEGFVDYGATINTVTFGNSPFINGSPTTSPPVSTPVSQAPFLVPIFSKRSLQTRVRLEDGQTVAMGGLLAESVQLVDDAVPGLGDMPIIGTLFRSKASQKVKSNLVIFCTVRIILPNGEPKYKEEDSQKSAGSPGLTVSLAP